MTIWINLKKLVLIKVSRNDHMLKDSHLKLRDGQKQSTVTGTRWVFPGVGVWRVLTGWSHRKPGRGWDGA